MHDGFGCSFAMHGVMDFVLHLFEERNGYGGIGIIVDAGRINFKHLPIEDLFGSTDVTNAFEQLLKVPAATEILQPIVIHGKAFFQIFLQDAGCPDAKLNAALRFHAVAHGDDDVEVVEHHGLIGIWNVHFLHIAFFIQFAFRKHLLNVPADDGSVALKKRGHLLSGKPHGILIEGSLYLCQTVGCRIDNHVVCHDSIFLPAIINHQFHYTIKVDQSVKKLEDISVKGGLMNTNMNIQRISIDRLKPAKYNPRKDLKPGDPAYEKIKRSLHEFGYVDPVIWNEVTGNIVGGHQRYKVLTAEGATEIDCVVVHIENPQEEKALNIALNKAVGEWEPVALADLLNDLKLSGYDMDATGFDAAEIDDLFSKVHDKDVKDDDCDIDPEQIEPFVQPGDIWLLGKHRMMCGDSTSEADVERLMGGDKANLVVTDPPYNVAYESADGKKIQNDSMADGQFYEFLLAAFRNMAAHMAEGGSAYIFHADTEGLNFRRAFKEAGFHISGVFILVKNSLVLGRSPYQWQHEPVLFGWLPNGKHRWFADRKQSTIWNFDKPKRSKEHPTMKPIPLLAYPIKNSSAPNSIVLDLFGGSGSTLMACEQTDRICRTMELDPKYATAIVMRYANEYGTENIRLLRNGEKLPYDAVAPQNSEHE